MNRRHCHPVVWLVVFPLLVSDVSAQSSNLGQRQSHIGYVYPAGLRSGSTAEVTVGGQYLDGVDAVYFSGQGLDATVVKHRKPLTQKQINQVREKLDQVRKQLQAEGKTVRLSGDRGKGSNYDLLVERVKQLGVTEEQLKAFDEFRKKRADPKRQLNPQLVETVAIQVTASPEVRPGRYQLRLKTPLGLSNPLNFDVGQWPEYVEVEPNDSAASAPLEGPLPVVLNGQILPGDVDRFRFRARRGQRLVVVAQARELMPYLADAVPGWFQATLALFDATGHEVAYDDDFQFHPDPVLFYRIPSNGWYELEIKDALYRGREDFVYRITLGQIPWVTSIFPLGGRVGQGAGVELDGWNLPVGEPAVDTANLPPGTHLISVRKKQWISNQVPYAVGTLPECLEVEPNDDPPRAQTVQVPVVVNGRIDRPGDWDTFRFEGRAGDQRVIEVQARRLNSPLDSLLKITDASGRQLFFNDDHADKGAGLVTHHADSHLLVTLPADGPYYVHLGDTQRHGGQQYGYRLRISDPRPDFELRVVPSTINVRAGTTVPVTVHALRRDGFQGDITLRLKDPPDGFELGGCWVPAGRDRIHVTVTVPPVAEGRPLALQLEGCAMIDGKPRCHAAVPADDMMQAFIYRHLVPSRDWVVWVSQRANRPGPLPTRGRGKQRAGRSKRQGGNPLVALVSRFERQPLRIPAGGRIRIDLPGPGRGPVNPLRLELVDPPDGITVDKVSTDRGGMILLFRADAAKVKPGLKGNLILQAFAQRAFQRPNTRRVSGRTLPAVRFEIVSSEARVRP